jgi:hypothetical protein
LSERSPSGLIEIDSSDNNFIAQSHPLAWTAPNLRSRLYKTIGIAILAACLASLEFTHLLSVGIIGLFPGLLALGALVQIWGLQRLRQQIFVLEANRDSLLLWEGLAADLKTEPDSAQRIPQPELSHCELAHAATGHTRTQPVLQWQQSSEKPKINWGAGLPEADLIWVLHAFQKWQNTDHA